MGRYRLCCTDRACPKQMVLGFEVDILLHFVFCVQRDAFIIEKYHVVSVDDTMWSVEIVERASQ